MFNKRIFLNIFSSNTPFDLVILSCNGKILKSVNLQSSFSKICIQTNSCCIKLLASFNEQTIYQKIYLSNCRNQNVFASFGFQKSVNPKVFNIITLTDSTYGFPVANAILNFK